MNRSDQDGNAKDFQITSLIDLLEQQDEDMEALFVKAINLYAAPGSRGRPDREKFDQLRLAVEQSLKGGHP